MCYEQEAVLAEKFGLCRFVFLSNRVQVCVCMCSEQFLWTLLDVFFFFFFSLTNSFLINCENRQKNAKSSAFHLFDVLSLGIVIRSTPNTYVVCKYELPVS